MMPRNLAILALLFIAPVVRADSISTVASDLRALVDEPFRFGVATDLATNILTAQSLAAYGGPTSLELSIESVVRAIGIDNTSYVGWASQDPITWLQSTIAIDPGATISIWPSALDFGEVPVWPAGGPADGTIWLGGGEWAVVATPEPTVWILVSVALVLGVFAAWRWIPRRKLSPPVIMTDYGPVTEWARKQAETNMRLDPEVRRQVEMQLADKYGSLEMGRKISRERYPGAYED